MTYEPFPTPPSFDPPPKHKLVERGSNGAIMLGFTMLVVAGAMGALVGRFLGGC